MNTIIESQRSTIIAKLELAISLHQHGQFDEADRLYVQVLKLQPANFDALHLRGVIALQTDQAEKGVKLIRQAIATNPNDPTAYSNLGNGLWDLKQYQAALNCYDRAIMLDPSHAEAYCNRGNIYRDMGKYQQAIDSYKRAIELNPAMAEVHWNLGLRYLELGNFAQGWQEYEWRWQGSQLKNCNLDFSQPLWHPKRVKDTVLVWGEQGLGDHVFYMGMLSDFSKAVSKVVVAIEPRLIPLLERSFPKISFISLEDKAISQARFDSQIPMGSLGQYFRNSLEDFPSPRQAYLKADSSLSYQLKQKLQKPGQLICGLSWISKNEKVGQDKSILLKDLKPILKLPQYVFVDLQYGDTSIERTQLKRNLKLEVTKLEEIDTFHDIDGLASLIEACDVIVTISNTTAHIAAAMGKPVFLMLPMASGLLWCWHQEREDSPWYPHVRIFRQHKIGDWTEVTKLVTLALAGLKG